MLNKGELPEKGGPPRVWAIFETNEQWNREMEQAVKKIEDIRVYEHTSFLLILRTSQRTLVLAISLSTIARPFLFLWRWIRRLIFKIS